eukprot:1159284-Pelagomonas_calceolata.AAC.8
MPPPHHSEAPSLLPPHLTLLCRSIAKRDSISMTHEPAPVPAPSSMLPHLALLGPHLTLLRRSITKRDSVSKAHEPTPSPSPVPPLHSEAPSPLPPHLALLGPCEQLPEGGLAAQLGHVGGAQDIFVLPDFKHMRSEIKVCGKEVRAWGFQGVWGGGGGGGENDVSQGWGTAAETVLAPRVHEVGDTVQASLRQASAALARPTIQEARAKKFEFIPSRSSLSVKFEFIPSRSSLSVFGQA